MLIKKSLNLIFKPIPEISTTKFYDPIKNMHVLLEYSSDAIRNECQNYQNKTMN